MTPHAAGCSISRTQHHLCVPLHAQSDHADHLIMIRQTPNEEQSILLKERERGGEREKYYIPQKCQ